MQTQRLNITMPIGIVKNLRRIIPARKRSKFIAQAVDEKLMHKRNLEKELVKSLKANKKIYDQIYEDWKHIEVQGWPG